MGLGVGVCAHPRLSVGWVGVSWVGFGVGLRVWSWGGGFWCFVCILACVPCNVLFVCNVLVIAQIWGAHQPTNVELRCYTETTDLESVAIRKKGFAEEARKIRKWTLGRRSAR